MRLSRPESPLSPLVASTTISPLTLPVAGSILNAPFLSLKVPCTVCAVVSRVQRIEVVEGSSVMAMGVAGACARAAAVSPRTTSSPSSAEQARMES